MSDLLLEVTGLCKRFGGLLATDHLSLDVHRGEIHALIGPNGAGKTTFIGQLQGEISPDSGTVRFNGNDITTVSRAERARSGIARSFQISSIFPELTVAANVSLAVQARAGHSFRFWQNAARDRSLLTPTLQILRTLGLRDKSGAMAADLSHSEKRQLELAIALASGPLLLLLDEPMAGLSRQDSARMTELIRGLKSTCTILLVEHDMDAVFSLADRITVLVSGAAIKSGSPDEIRGDPEVRSLYLGRRG